MVTLKAIFFQWPLKGRPISYLLHFPMMSIVIDDYCHIKVIFRASTMCLRFFHYVHTLDRVDSDIEMRYSVSCIWRGRGWSYKYRFVLKQFTRLILLSKINNKFVFPLYWRTTFWSLSVVMWKRKMRKLFEDNWMSLRTW